MLLNLSPTQLEEALDKVSLGIGSTTPILH